jgi:YVTN family beta-propeller protein
VIATAVAIPLFALGGHGVDHADLGETPVNSVGVFDANSGAARTAVELPAPPTAVAAGHGFVWAASADSNAVYAVDPKTNTKLQTIPVGNAPGGIAVGGGYVWVTNSLAGTVSQIDPRAQIELQQIHVGNGPTGIAVGGAGKGGEREIFPSPRTRIGPGHIPAIDQPIPNSTPPTTVPRWSGLSSILSGFPSAVRPRRFNSHSPAAVTVGLGSVWVANSGDGTVMQIDPVAEKVVGTVKVGAGPSGIAIVQGEVWTANELDGTISRIDSAKRLPRTVHVGGRPSAVAPGDGTAYVALRPTGMAHRGGTLRVALFSFEPLTTVDLAVGSNSSLSRFAALTNDGLLAYQHEAGQAGYQLVPDLARLKPDISLDRKTYTFRLRPNIHYSNGRLVKASDFRYAIERSSSSRTPIFPRHFRGSAGRAVHQRRVISARIKTDDRAGTIRYHLSALTPTSYNSPRLLQPSPPRRCGRRSDRCLHGRCIVSFTAIRSGWCEPFRQWSDKAQPGVSTRSYQPPTPGRGLPSSGRQGRSASSQPRPFSCADAVRKHSIRLPVSLPGSRPHRPPFNDLRARRALNYALDRKKVMQLTRKPCAQSRVAANSRDTAYCPYTLDASPADS